MCVLFWILNFIDYNIGFINLLSNSWLLSRILDIWLSFILLIRLGME